MCKYSKFRIESNSYLLFDSKPMQLFEIFEYLFNGDQPGDWHAICLYFASQKLLHSRVSWTQCCAACVPTPPTPLSALTTHARTHARECVRRAPSATLNRDIWWRYNGGRQTAHGQLSTALSVSIVMSSTLSQRHAAFKFRGDTGPAGVILSLSLAHAACCLVSAVQVRKTTSAQLQPRIAIVTDWQAQ